MSHGSRRPRSGSSRSSSSSAGSSDSSGSALPPQFPPASFPPSDGSSPDDPETVRKWHNRRADVIALELILRAERVDNGRKAFHRCRGKIIPAFIPSGRDRTDLWSWTFGSTCPRFHEDLAELAGLEATALADGLDEIYIRELMAALSLPPSDADGRPKSAEMLTLGSLFRLTTAPPTARLFALISTYLYAKEHGLLRE